MNSDKSSSAPKVKDGHPKVTIGLPVHNGERFLSSAIESLLDQTFTDFEIVISDNASTDQTRDICEKFAAVDGRIRYYRQDRNLGAAPNFNRTFYHARGKYFKWAAHDDILDSTFLAKCVDVLDNHPRTVLCSSSVQFIDENGNYIPTQGPLLSGTQSLYGPERFSSVISMSHWCFDIFGLMRTEALTQSPLIGGYVGSDRNTLAALSLLGPFHRVEETLFFSRDHSDRSVRKYAKNLSGHWYDATKRIRVSFPHWRIWLEFIKTVACSNLNAVDRFQCYRFLAVWPRIHSKLLKKDLVLGGKCCLKQALVPHRM